MEISNLNYFVERIVDLSTSNQVLCEQRREFEDKIEKLEKRIEELESLEAFHTQDDHPEYPTRFTLHNVEYFENAQGCFMIANDGKETFTVEITHQEYLDGVNQYIKTQE